MPAQHFSQRTLWDGNTRLWAAWAVLSRERRLYFSGDTGYFAGFKEIGKRLGPFDVAAMAIGAYEPPEIMKSVHLTPEEAVQAFVDLNARTMLGIHWGTFDLAEEPLDEPPVRMLAEIHRRGIGSDACLDPQSRGNAPVVKSPASRMGALSKWSLWVIATGRFLALASTTLCTQRIFLSAMKILNYSSH